MKRKTEYTIVDIARALGISPSTVSRALKDHPFISQATKERVKKQAAKMGYRRNVLAAGLRNQRSNTIGLIVPRISMYFQSAVITAIQHRIHASGLNLIISQSNDSYALEQELVNTMYDSRVEALIASCTIHTTDFSHFDGFLNSRIPLVFFDRVPRHYPAQVVRGDDFQGGYRVAEHLIARGSRRIAFINGLSSCNLYQDRLAGFKSALKKARLPLEKSWVFSQELTAENALKSCDLLFRRKPFPDAIFAANDTSAIVVEQVALSRGLRIPEDLRIVGYSNDPRSAIITPAISTVEQFPAEVGLKTAEAALSLIRQKRSPRGGFQDIVTPVELIVRASS